MLTKNICFSEIEPVWRAELWPGRSSAIETHSAMTWPFSFQNDPYDMRIFDYEASFWAVYDRHQIVAVNSGHRTSDLQYRSRGLWVHPEYRNRGLSQTLLAATQHQAHTEGAIMIWTVPRKTALPAYTKFGFTTVGDFFSTETAEANIYAVKQL
jgi:GNAT superfamily N-acetyltransferase